MKKTILAVAAVLGLAGAASAATYTVDVSANPFRAPGQPGLQTRAWILSNIGAQQFNGSTLSFNLSNIGDSVTLDLFRLVHFDAPLNGDDLIHSPSTVTFNFGAFGTQTVNGETFGLGNPGGTAGSAFADYLNDVSFNIGGGLRIIASVADTVFGSDTQGTFVNGLPGAGVVKATFTLAPVPLPATLPLGMGALALMGFVARRRKGAAA